jgi:hypothetical protein
LPPRSNDGICPTPDLRANGFRRHRGVGPGSSTAVAPMVGWHIIASVPSRCNAGALSLAIGRRQVAEAKQDFKWPFATSNQPCARRPNGMRRLRRTSRSTRACHLRLSTSSTGHTKLNPKPATTASRAMILRRPIANNARSSRRNAPRPVGCASCSSSPSLRERVPTPRSQSGGGG